MNTATTETNIADHPVVSSDQWIAERKALLAREKELTHLRDQIARERRALPWVRVEKDYVFDTPEGPRTLADLFEGRRQLLVQHFMFGAGLGAGLPELLLHGRPHRRHERAPGASRRHASWPSRARRWPRSSASASAWAGSSSGCPRTAATSTTTSASASRRKRWPAARSTTTTACGPSRSEEAPGISVFYKDDAGEVFHTYSTYGRGVEVMMGTYNLLDLTPKGRDEDDVATSMEWVRHHDRYAPATGCEAGGGSCCEAHG